MGWFITVWGWILGLELTYVSPYPLIENEVMGLVRRE